MGQAHFRHGSQQQGRGRQHFGDVSGRDDRGEKSIEQPDELDILFEELAREEEEALFVEDLNKASEEKAETLDPWERPSDWWKRSKEE